MRKDMKDEFEKYVVQHRSEIDTEEPDRDFLWEGVQVALLKQKYKRRVKIWQVAAVLFAVIAMGQLTYLFLNPSEYAILFEELDYIKEVEGEFRSDIPLVNDKERLAEILVDTYEKKIKLLERLLEQIERDEMRQQQFKEL